jgi:hypothetical protein
VLVLNSSFIVSVPVLDCPVSWAIVAPPLPDTSFLSVTVDPVMIKEKPVPEDVTKQRPDSLDPEG